MEQLERKQFTFFRSFADCICRIKSKAARCDAYDAIVRYALDGTEPDLDKLPDAAAMAFVMAKPVLDSCRRKAESGKRGGKAKDNESKPEANVKQNESKPEANRKGERERERDRDRERMLLPPISPTGGEEAPAKVSKDDEAFDRFWAAYPKKIGKGAARVAFDKARKKTGADELIAAVEKQKQSDQWTREAGRYIPNAATWLNQGRWEDELPAKDNSKPSGQFQRAGQKISPMMRDYVKQMMEEGADEC